MVKKLLWVVFFSASLIFPHATQAAGVIPELNTLCWKQEDCLRTRAKLLGKDMSAPEVQSGWKEKEDPCNKSGWGKCLPAGSTITSISFAGRREFSDVGDFIQAMYRYGLGVGAIIAAVMVLIAGAQWITSGGNSEGISSAKKRIAGAISGLVLLYLSYFILNTLNPALVNLRLPQTWLIRGERLVAQFCSQMPSGTTFAFAANSTEADQLKPVSATGSLEYNLTYKSSPDQTFFCGKRFFVKDGGDRTCYGDICGEPNTTCALDMESDKNFYWCQQGNVFGTITHNSIRKNFAPDVLTEEWADPSVTEIYSAAVCKTAVHLNLKDNTDTLKPSPDKKTIKYRYNLVNTTMDEMIAKCETPEFGGFVGFVLVFEMNESTDLTNESHFIGRNGLDLGDRGFFFEHSKQMDKSNFFTPEEIKKGVYLDVEAASVKDIDEDGDRGVYYQRFNISK